jgi:hypothetical protein
MFMTRVSPASAHTTLINFNGWFTITPFTATVWQLIGLTSWVLDFSGHLMKECILFGEQPAGTEGAKVDGDDDDDDDDLFGSAPCG